MDASMIAIPFSLVGAGPGSWLQQIAATYRLAVQGDADAARDLKINAGLTDDQWLAAHPDALTVHNDPHAYDYARNAYRASWAALQSAGVLQAGGTASVQAAPAGGATSAAKAAVPWIVGLVAVYFLAKWLL